MACADLSDQMWLSGFNDVGKLLFGMTGNELVDLRVRVLGILENTYLFLSQENNEKRYQRALRQCNGQKFTFECRAKTDSYNVSGVRMCHKV